jgi:hypothetical protein
MVHVAPAKKRKIFYSAANVQALGCGTNSSIHVVRILPLPKHVRTRVNILLVPLPRATKNNAGALHVVIDLFKFNQCNAKIPTLAESLDIFLS